MAGQLARKFPLVLGPKAIGSEPQTSSFLTFFNQVPDALIIGREDSGDLAAALVRTHQHRQTVKNNQSN